ncbi:MAG: DUF5522 domain-containing protein [Acidimicrobiia bacterium]
MRRDAVADRPLAVPHASRLDPDREDYDDVLAAHADALASGADGYLDPRTGLFVFTAAWLVGRGSCCDTGCRHCPYVS